MSSSQTCRKIPKPSESCPSGSPSPEPSPAAADGRLSSDFAQESQNRPQRGRRARQHQNTETEGHADLLQKAEDSHSEEQTDHATRQQSEISQTQRTRPHNTHQGKPQLDSRTSVRGRPGSNRHLHSSPKTQKQGRLSSSPQALKQSQSKLNKCLSSSPKRAAQGRPPNNPKTSRSGPNKILICSPKTPQQDRLGSRPKTPKCTQSGPKRVQSRKTPKQGQSQHKSQVSSVSKTVKRGRGRPRLNPQLSPKTSKPGPNKPFSSSPKTSKQGQLGSSQKTPKCTQSEPKKHQRSSPKTAKQTQSQHKSQVGSVPKTLKRGRGRPRHNPQPGPKPSKHRPKKPLSSSPKIPNQGRLDSSPKTPKCTQSGPTEDLSSSLKQGLSQHKSQVSSVPQTLKRGRGRPRLNPQLGPETSSSGPNNPLTYSPKTPPLSSSPTLLKHGQLPSSPETPNHPQSGSNCPVSSSPKTPERGRGRHNPPLSSTPGYNRAELKEPEISPVKKTQPKKRFRSQEAGAQQRKRRKTEQEAREALPIQQCRREGGMAAELSPKQPVTSVRRCFEIHESELQDPVDELSSDLSIELSVQENKHTLSLDEEDEEDEELPSFLQRQKPSIREGLCVWCKLRKYPFWPAVVKSVNHKSKKASIVFIDQFLFDKRICKGLSVSLRTLKPFDCEESVSFVDKAKERYGKCIMLCVKLISDYRIRVGCGFVGSIIEYIADDISYPLRSEYIKASSSLLSPTQSLIEQQGGDFELQECDAVSGDLEDSHVTKKVLPDRSQAARNRANQRLVDFIVKGGAETRLMSVIGGQEASKWLQALQSPTRHLVEVYLEDEEQVESVYRYLEQLYKSVPKSSLLLENAEQIPFILDVLFPEALICALARVDGLSMEKAEEKFRQGPRHSNRERQEFDRMIEQQMNLKAVR